MLSPARPRISSRHGTPQGAAGFPQSSRLPVPPIPPRIRSLPEGLSSIRIVYSGMTEHEVLFLLYICSRGWYRTCSAWEDRGAARGVPVGGARPVAET